MTSLTWCFNSGLCLLGCGVDSEKIQRFSRILKDEFPQFPLVFSKKEIQYILDSSDPAKTMCACFCLKEAVFKALKEPYNFNKCELFPDLDKKFNDFHLPPSLCGKYHVKSSFCVINQPVENREEMVVVAYLLG